MDSTLIQFNNVSKIYNGQMTVKDVSLTIQSGEIVALCGGNGAGKSTLLRMLAGTIGIDQGTIEIDNVSWNNNRQQYAQFIGYMPDDYNFSQGLTAFETLLFWAKLRGLNKERVNEVFDEVGLMEFAHKNATSYSKGMRQRLLFAQALLSKPKVLIMDEPTNGLDPYWMQSFVHLVKQYASNGQTIIFSTHQLQIADALANRVVFLKAGEIVIDGYTDQLNNEYGSSSMQKMFGELYGL